MAKADEYMAIKVWGSRNRKAESQTLAAQLHAQDTDAPLNAIYWFDGDEATPAKWMTTEDIADETTRDGFMADVAELKAGN